MNVIVNANAGIDTVNEEPGHIVLSFLYLQKFYWNSK